MSENIPSGVHQAKIQINLRIRAVRSESFLQAHFFVGLLKSNLNGSNIFGTMEICSRYG